MPIDDAAEIDPTQSPTGMPWTLPEMELAKNFNTYPRMSTIFLFHGK